MFSPFFIFCLGWKFWGDDFFRPDSFFVNPGGSKLRGLQVEMIWIYLEDGIPGILSSDRVKTPIWVFPKIWENPPNHPF